LPAISAAKVQTFGQQISLQKTVFRIPGARRLCASSGDLYFRSRKHTMDLRLYYKEPSWDENCWAVVDEADPQQVFASDLSAKEAMRQCNDLNHHNMRWDIAQRVAVRFQGYPSTSIDLKESE